LPGSIVFPYTTLFRSEVFGELDVVGRRRVAAPVLEPVELDPVRVCVRWEVFDRAQPGVLGPGIGAAFHADGRAVPLFRSRPVAGLHVAVPDRAVDLARVRGRAAAPPQLE